MHHATAHQPASTAPLLERRPWSPLVLLCAAQFMVIIDITVVNVALPSIGRALRFAGADLPWVVAAYVLVSGGRLRDLGVLGALAVTAGLALLAYAIEGTATYGWGSARALGALLLSVGALAAFAAVERRAPRPLAAPARGRARSLVSGGAVMLGATGTMGGTFFLSSLYLQRALGASALAAGAAFLPLAVAIVLAALPSVRPAGAARMGLHGG